MSRTAFSLIPYSRATTVADTGFLALLDDWRCESNGRDRRNISTASSLVRIARFFKLLRPELLDRDLSSSDPLSSDAARSQFGSSIDIARGTSKEISPEKPPTAERAPVPIFENMLFRRYHGKICTATCVLHGLNPQSANLQRDFLCFDSFDKTCAPLSTKSRDKWDFCL
jgi:hypothetical protein